MRTAGSRRAQNERSHAVGILKRKFLGNHATHGSAEYVRALDARSIQDGSSVRRHQRHGIDSWRYIALANATIVESDGAITLSENGTAAMPHVGGVAETHDE